jgi:hypothetical protein
MASASPRPITPAYHPDNARTASLNLHAPDVEISLVPPGHRTQRQRKIWLYEKLINFILWVTVNVTALIWGHYFVKISIFPLCPENRAIQKNSASSFFFSWLGGQWIAYICIINMLCIWKFLGPVITRRAGATDTQTQDQQPAPVAVIPPRSTRRDIMKIALMFVGLVLALAFMTVLYGIGGVPSWVIIPSYQLWARSAWEGEVCEGWDYKITFAGIHFDQLGMESEEGKGQEFLSNASLVSTSGALTEITLQHPASNLFLITVVDHGDNSTILFNFTASQFWSSIDLSNGTVVRSPGLSFPDLSLRSQYSEIIWNPYCSAPQVSLVESNNSEILVTILSNPDDCTMLRACGRGPFDTLIVPVGLLLTEVEKAGLCCTNPVGYVHHGPSH